MAEQPRQTVEVRPAKGRPMLTWVGKRSLERVTAFPAQLVETFNPTGESDQRNLLFYGDNKEVLAYLLASGYRSKVNLVYIDPPFDSGADYVRRVSVSGVSGVAKVDGEHYSFSEQTQYTDIWANDNYLQFMYERFLLLKELLAEGGALWLHCDWHRSHMLRLLLEEVFGGGSIRNEIIWQRTASRNDAKSFGHVHDTLYYVVKGVGSHVWNQQFAEYDQEYIDRYYNLDDGDGRRYAADNLTAAGLRSGSSGKPWRGFDPGAEGRHWKYTVDKLEQLDVEGKIYWPKGGKGFPRYKRYLDELPGKPISSIWSDIYVINSQAEERGDYPTQKPEDLIERLILTTSNQGDLVLDCFVGSGTTAAVAQKLGRRWLVSDINKGAIQTTSKRLQGIILNQARQAAPLMESEGETKPASLAFSVYRVNDYDLQIQHNEAINLACEHIGITRTRTDSFFDGTLGNRLVKIIPLTHPLTLLDLQLIQDELRTRPDEQRHIVVVCLGKEIAVDPWVEQWNQRRPVARRDTQGRPVEWVNRIDVIELRTDERYGKFFVHQPARADVEIQRDGSNIVVEIRDFISPTIIQRLNMDQTLFRAQITDWRAMVDCVMIDPAYNGQVFNVARSDVPERKSDLVHGRYELTAPPGATTVAVKIIDMLGEEVIVTATV